MDDSLDVCQISFAQMTTTVEALVDRKVLAKAQFGGTV